MPAVGGHSGAPSSLGQVIGACPHGAVVVVCVWDDEGNGGIEGAQLTLTLTAGGQSASAVTDGGGEAHFRLTALPAGPVQYRLRLRHAATSRDITYPASGNYTIVIGRIERIDLVERPILTWAGQGLSGEAGAWALAKTQGMAAPAELTVEFNWRGRVRLSIVEAEGVHARERNRSGNGVPGYLSRLRATLDANGITRPITFPHEYDNDPDHPFSFHAIGLEYGVETLKAEVITATGFALPAAGLRDRLTVTVAAAPVASYRVFYAASDADFTAADPELAALLALKRPGVDFTAPANAVTMAVLDNGIYRSGAYLTNGVSGGSSFVTGQIGDYGTYRDNLDDPHGSSVAGQALFGSAALRVMDVRMTRGQIGGDPVAVITPAMQWVNAQAGVRVLTTSVGFDWSAASIVAERSAGMIYCSTAGNNLQAIVPQARARFAFPEGILIARCMLDRATHVRSPHAQTGRGMGVDLVVPGNFTVLHLPRQQKILLNGIAQARYNSRRDEHDAARDAQALWDATKAAWVAAQVAEAQAAGDRTPAVMLKMRIANDYAPAQPRPAVGTAPDQPNIRDTGDDLNRDEGVSFGVPVVANTAAKMLLLVPGLTPAQVKNMLIDTSDIGDGLGGTCRAGGVMNPLRAYFAAFDH